MKATILPVAILLYCGLCTASDVFLITASDMFLIFTTQLFSLSCTYKLYNALLCIH